ncbi:hypothetical protein BpHYR1_005477 [Brachionus plicatilis]|uniref:Uncharacterized protein n=1 Tax=Brachionus plicatilis TaxID=10195 RepID=A0A3M7S396_BRAPC|nr:hypothetical protein BpHYR1_005477 [Brachionus plicatilis]
MVQASRRKPISLLNGTVSSFICHGIKILRYSTNSHEQGIDFMHIFQPLKQLCLNACQASYNAIKSIFPTAQVISLFFIYE